MLFQTVSPTDLQSVLLWIVTGAGSAYLTGRILSLLAENWAFWHKLSSQLKFIISIATAALISVGAQLLLGEPEVLEAIAPWFTLVMQAIIEWLGSQQQYIQAKRVEYGAK